MGLLYFAAPCTYVCMYVRMCIHMCEQMLMSAAQVHITVNMVSTATTDKDHSVVQVLFLSVFCTLVCSFYSAPVRC